MIELIVLGGISDEHISKEAPNSKLPHYQWVETQILHLGLSQSSLLLVLYALIKAVSQDVSSECDNKR